METIYKWPFDEAKAQYAIDTLLYDEPWKLWEYQWGISQTEFWPNLKTPAFNSTHVIYKRTEPKP